MTAKLSKFESQIQDFLNADLSINTIAITLQKSIKLIKNAIYRINLKSKISKSPEKILKEPKELNKKGLSEREKRIINRDLIKEPKTQNKSLLNDNNIKSSKRTLQRFLKDQNYSVNKSLKKPFLNKKKAKKRLKYVKNQLKNIKNINIKKIIFSDESVIERGSGLRLEYYRIKDKRDVRPNIISTSSRSKFQKFLKYLKKTRFFSLYFKYFIFLITNLDLFL
jgi:hypothetical protein